MCESCFSVRAEAGMKAEHNKSQLKYPQIRFCVSPVTWLKLIQASLWHGRKHHVCRMSTPLWTQDILLSLFFFFEFHAGQSNIRINILKPHTNKNWQTGCSWISTAVIVEVCESSSAHCPCEYNCQVNLH